MPLAQCLGTLAYKTDQIPFGDGCHQTPECVAANVLNRAFDAASANRKWVADFTYLWTAEGWPYVAAVIDLFSRRVVGWSMSATMTAQLVTDALMMAIWRGGARCILSCITPIAGASYQ
jgi:transposase InsO family protein